MKNRFLIPFILLLILGISFLLSSKMILHGDFFYLFDQARDFMLVQDIVQTHKIPLIGTHSGLGGFFHGPLWLCMLIPFYLLGGGNPFTFTYAYILLALVTVLAGFFIGKKLYDTKTGLLFAFFLAISPNIWASVPNTIGVNVLPIVFIFLFYFLVKYIRGDSMAYVFAIFFAGIALQFETALPLVLLQAVIASFFLNRKAFRQIKVILLSIASFSISIATFILFDVRHQFLMTHALIGLATQHTHDKGYLSFFERVFNHFDSFRNVYESVLVQKTILLESLLLLLFAGFLFYLKKKKILHKKFTKEFWYLLLFPLGLYLLYLGYAYPIYPEYLLGLTVPVGLAVSILIVSLWKEKIGKLLVILFLGANMLFAGMILFTPYHQNQTSGAYLNQKQVTEWVINDSKGKQFGYFVYTPETFTYGIDYLFWWESKQEQSPQPVSKKLSTTYLIMFPGLTGDEGAHAFWEKTTIKTKAPAVETKTFTGGIVVEKLVIKPGEPDADLNYYQNLIFR